MKYPILLVVIFVMSIQLTWGQKRQAAAINKANFVKSVQWETKLLKKWGINSLSLPDNLIGDADGVSPQKNGDVSWTNYSKVWKPSATKQGLKIARVELEVTNWDVPFSKVAPDMKPEDATPENFLLLDLFGDIRNRQEKNSRVESADYHEIDGVKGSLVQIRDFENRNQIMLVWQFFRYFNGKSQRIVFRVTAPRSELQAANKIIDFLRLEKE